MPATEPTSKPRAFFGAGPRRNPAPWPPLPLFLALMALLLAGGCQRKETSAPPNGLQPRSGGTLRILQEAADRLDPICVGDVYESTVVNQIYEGLVRFDPDTGVRPELAESWVIVDSGRVYRFTLRPGVRFQNGEPLTAEAVVRSITRCLDPHKEMPCLAETYLQGIAGARDFAAGRAASISGLRAEDEHTVVIRLDTPLSFFLSVLSMDQVKIIPPEAGRESLENHPVGTGPFRFVARQGGEKITLARNESYWGEKARVDTLQFLAATRLTPMESVARLLRGEVHEIAIPSSQQPMLEKVAGYPILRCPDISVTFLGLNTRIPPLDRLEVRQAFAMAVDRKGLIPPQSSNRELANGVLPPGLAGYSPESKVLPYDPPRARALLAAAGYDALHPVPPIDYYTSRSSTQWMEQALTRQLAAVGISLQVHYLSWPELDDRITRREAASFSLSWVADVPDPDAFLYLLFRTGGRFNLFAFSDAQVDSLLSEGRRLPPGPSRYATYRRCEARVLQIAPMIPLYHDASLYAWNPALAGVELNQFGIAQVPFSRIWFRPRELAQNGSGGSTP